jgi:outer membrane protein OmpA-like peptidoglycan-associated protein
VRQPGHFNQDDFAGLLLGLAVIIFLMLWLLRGRDQAAIPDENAQVLPQSAGAPASPASDPFGDLPVDLKPKGPVPGLPQKTASYEAETLQSSLAPTSSTPGGVLASPSASVQPAVSQSPAAPAAGVGLPAPLSGRPGGAPAASAWFCTGSSTLSDTARSEILRSISLQSARDPDAVIVHAYADTRGSSVYNLALSGARARVVADFLRTNGLTVIEAEGMGEVGGIADNLDCANQRRADIFFRSERAVQPSVSCVPPPEATASACL